MTETTPKTTQLQADTTQIVLGASELPERDHPYTVLFDAAPYIVLRIAFTAEHRNAGWTHPNVVARGNELLEFKHSRADGHKWWTSKAGVENYLVLPKTAFALVHQCGYSWPKFMVNGQKITLSVSGGCGGDRPGWTDVVRGYASTSVNLPLRTLKALAAVSLTVEKCREVGVTVEPHKLSEYSLKGWRSKWAKQDVKLAPGVQMVLAEGYSAFGSQGPFPFDSMTSTGRQYLVKTGLGLVRCRENSIDWSATATANGVPLRDPSCGAFNLLPAPAKADAAA
jgi:hypothetical protein